MLACLQGPGSSRACSLASGVGHLNPGTLVPTKSGTKFMCTLGPFRLKKKKKKVSSRDLVPGHWSFLCAHFCSPVSHAVAGFLRVPATLWLRRRASPPGPLGPLGTSQPGARRIPPREGRGRAGAAVSGSAGSGPGRARTSRARGAGEPWSPRAGGFWRSPRRSCARGSALRSPHPGPRQPARRRRAGGGRYPPGPGAATVPAAC